MSADLAAWLRAQLVADELVARSAGECSGEAWTGTELEPWAGYRIEGTKEGHTNPRACSGDLELWDDEGALGMYGEVAEHIARHDPAFVLADIAAKRAIVDEYLRVCARPLEDGYDAGYERGSERAVRLLAQPYRDRPGWREEWGL